MSFRIEQINSVIQQELSGIFLKVLGKGASLITITAVETTKDLSQAKVWVSIYGRQAETMQQIQHNIYEIQGCLNKILHLHKMPRLIIKLDQSANHINRINQILQSNQK